jgi:glycosyltransferase involved in cell wall biosynthesis
MPQPLISVITAVYNGASHIEETIESILNQTLGDFEYIIIDDASSDDSVERILGYTDSRIKLIRNAVNSRLVNTRNRGLNMSSGRYIALIDHDDVADKSRFEIQHGFLDKESDFILVGSQSENIDEDGALLAPRIAREDTPEQLLVRLLFRNPFVNSTLFFRRGGENPMSYRPEFPLAEDYDFITRIAQRGKINIVPDKLIKYRIHSANYSSAARTDILALGREVKRQQLQRLGVTFSEDELLLHSGIEHQALTLNSPTLKAIAAWFKKLRDANDRTHLYAKQSFNSVIYDELANIGEYAAKGGNVRSFDFFSEVYFSALRADPKAAFRILAKLAMSNFGIITSN